MTTLRRTDKLELSNTQLWVNGKPFVVEYPDEPMLEIVDGQLVTCFRGSRAMKNYWNPEDIEGYWA